MRNSDRWGKWRKGLCGETEVICPCTEEEVRLLRSLLLGLPGVPSCFVMPSSEVITEPLDCLQLRHSIVACLPVVLLYRIKNKDHVPCWVMVLEGSRAGAVWGRAQWKQ